MRPPYALLRAAIDGGPPLTGGIEASPGALCQLSADPGGLAGASQLRWEIVDYPIGWSLPLGWSVDSAGVYFNTDQLPPAFHLPTVEHWGKVMFRLTLNNSVSTNPLIIPLAQLIDDSTAVSVLSSTGLRDLGFNEEAQFSISKLWTSDHKKNLRVLEAFIAGSGGGDGISAGSGLTKSGNVISLSLTSVPPANSTKSASAVGTASEAARADHKHDVTTATAVSVGAANGEGTSTSLARADHTHAVSNLALASQARGDLAYFNGTIWSRLALGPIGFSLVSQGAGSDPHWAQPVASKITNDGATAAFIGTDVASALDFIQSELLTLIASTSAQPGDTFVWSGSALVPSTNYGTGTGYQKQFIWDADDDAGLFPFLYDFRHNGTSILRLNVNPRSITVTNGIRIHQEPSQQASIHSDGDLVISAAPNHELILSDVISFTVAPATPNSAPASGFILYMDPADNKVKIWKAGAGSPTVLVS